MYAIVEITGHQYKVEKDDQIFVNQIFDVEEGDELEFDSVLLVDKGEEVQVGQPVVEDAKVYVSVVGNVKGDKVQVFKKKRRKGYQKSNGHRQYLTQLIIEDILTDGAVREDFDAEEKIVNEEVETTVTEETTTPETVEETPKTVEETTSEETSDEEKKNKN